MTIAISLGIAAVGLLVLGAELWRTRTAWPWDPGLLRLVPGGLLLLLVLGWGVGLPVRLGMGLGAGLGLLLLALAPYGRAGQGLVVLVSAAALLLPGDPQGVMPLLAGVGVGVGGVTIPMVGRWPGLGMTLTQVWLSIAGMVWGSRLMQIASGEERWLLEGIPVVMALVVGAGSLLMGWQDQPRWQLGLARVLAAGLAVFAGLIVERNLLGQSGSLTLFMAVGMILAVIVGTWEAGQETDYLWRGGVTLAVAGGAALLALRLGGSHGAAVMGLGCLLVPGAEAIALFLGIRPLVQSLIDGYGLTNISLTHSYTNAGLFLGIAAVALGGILWGRYQGSWRSILLAAVTLGGVVGVGYFFHTQPQAAFLLGSLMAAFVVAVLAPLTPLPWQSWGIMALILVGWGSLIALVTPEILQAGIDASRWQRLLVLAVATILVGILAGGIGLAQQGRSHTAVESQVR